MLSASSVSSPASRQFSSSHSKSARGSGKPSNSNPLTELIHAEKGYLETLKIIDSQIAPIWMKQTQAAAPEFSELLRCVHDILTCNKRFCGKLMEVSAMKELGNVLMQWVDDMELAYTRFAKGFIRNLNQRHDILSNDAIRQLLRKLSVNAANEVTLESLFNTPIQQLKYYKLLYDRLFESTKPGRSDHKLLLISSQRIGAVLRIAQRSVSATTDIVSPSTSTVSTAHGTRPEAVKMTMLTPRKAELVTQHDSSISLDDDLSSDQRQFASMTDEELALFENQVDYSKVTDIFSQKRITYRLQWSGSNMFVVMRNSFMLVDDHGYNASARVHLVLTTIELTLFEEITVDQMQTGNKLKYALMYPPVAIRDVHVKSVSLERELVGEYLLRLILFNRTQLTLRADTKQVRNMWVGADPTALSSTTLALQPLADVVRNISEKKERQARGLPTGVEDSTNDNTISNENGHDGEAILSLYADDSDDDEPLITRVHARKDVDYSSSSNRDTVVDLYEARLSDGMDEYPLPNALPLNDKPTHHHDAQDSKDAVDEDGQSLENIKPQRVKLVDDVHAPKCEAAVSAKTDTVAPTTSAKLAVEKASVNSSVVVPEKGVIQKETGNDTENDEPVAVASTPVTMIHLESAPEHKIAISSQEVISSEDTSVSAKPNEASAPPCQEKQLPETPGSQPQSTTGNVHSIIPRSSSRAAMVRPVKAPAVQTSLPPRSTSKLKGLPASPVMHQPLHRTASGSHPSHGPMPVMSAQQQQQDIRLPPNHSYSPRPYYSPQLHRPAIPSPVQQNRPPILVPGAHPAMTNSLSSTTSAQQSRNQHLHFPLKSTSTPNTPIALHNRPAPPPLGLYSHHSMASDDMSSPPLSPGAFANATRQILFTHRHCEVFHWKDETWYASESPCSIQVRLTNANRSRLNLQLINSGEVYLDTWILPSTTFSLMGETDVSLTLQLDAGSENYLLHFSNTQVAKELTQVLQQIHKDAVQMWGSPEPAAGPYPGGPALRTVPSLASMSRSDSFPRHVAHVPEEENTLSALSAREEAPQTLVPVMQCRCKLFSQNEHSNWSNLGSIGIRISLQMPSKKTHIFFADGNTRIASGIVPSHNVEMMNAKRVTILLNDEKSRTNKVYMIHLKNEQTAKKVYDCLKTKNSQNGW